VLAELLDRSAGAPAHRCAVIALALPLSRLACGSCCLVFVVLSFSVVSCVLRRGRCCSMIGDAVAVAVGVEREGSDVVPDQTPGRACVQRSRRMSACAVFVVLTVADV
jgi:hypothetical protein